MDTQPSYPFDRLLALATLSTLLLATAAGFGLNRWLDLTPWAPVIAASPVMVMMLASEPARRREHGQTFGAANGITLFRSVWVGGVACMMSAAPTDNAAWVVVGLAMVALALDGLDGRVARATESTSIYGAQLDMELDAALMMVLSGLCWVWGRAGLWVLACGLLRYAWVAASLAFEWMRQDLPPSWRRKACCVLGTGGLVAAVAPLKYISEAFAMMATGILCFSFTVDFLWLLAARPRSIR